VPIDTLATNQVEVIRGPAALRYGSTSIGGIVSATNNRIPDALPLCAAAPFQTYGLPVKAPLASVQSPGCVTAETRTAVNSVDRGVESGVLLDAGGGNFALHADAYGRTTRDYQIPSYPYCLFPVSRSTAASRIRRRGRTAPRSAAPIFSMAALSARRSPRTTRCNHIPGRWRRSRTRIDAHQTKITAKGEYRPDAAAIDAIRFWAGAVDYRHNAIGLADPADPTTLGVRRPLPTRSRKSGSKCS
jgi:iron complex outermembrane receptor protein